MPHSGKRLFRWAGKNSACPNRLEDADVAFFAYLDIQQKAEEGLF